MRTIKFRAYHNSDKKMIYFSLYNPLDFPNKPWNQYEVMQFTGLVDKNGKEIYEGDIVTFDNENYEIKYYDSIGAFTPTNEDGENMGGWPEMEVIGNIYENKELLK